jgi:hypothetical protein
METIKQVFSQAFPGQQVLGDYAPNYWVVYGSNQQPRWIVPRDCQLGFKVLNQWHPFNNLANLKWKFFLMAYKFGALNFLPNLKPICLDTNILPSDPLVFYIGTPSSVQKLVVTLLERETGLPTAIMKLPIGKDATGNIRHEATILEELHSWKDKISPLLHSITPQGISMQEAFDGKIAGFDLTRQHIDLLAKLKHDNKYTTLQEQAIALKDSSASFSMSEEEKELFESILNVLEDETELPSFCNHGDFSPWNVITGKQGLLLFDWERASFQGLPVIDLFHFLMTQRLILKKEPLFQAYRHASVQEYLQRIKFNASEAVLKKLCLYYFVGNWLNTRKEGSLEEKEKALQNLKKAWVTLR